MIRIKLSTHLIIQALAMAIQVLNQLQVGHIFPPEWAPRITVIVGMLQATVAAVAQFSNTNGTPQELPGGAAADPAIKGGGK